MHDRKPQSQKMQESQKFIHFPCNSNGQVSTFSPIKKEKEKRKGGILAHPEAQPHSNVQLNPANSEPHFVWIGSQLLLLQEAQTHGSNPDSSLGSQLIHVPAHPDEKCFETHHNLIKFVKAKIKKMSAVQGLEARVQDIFRIM